MFKTFSGHNSDDVLQALRRAICQGSTYEAINLTFDLFWNKGRNSDKYTKNPAIAILKKSLLQWCAEDIGLTYPSFTAIFLEYFNDEVNINQDERKVKLQMDDPHSRFVKIDLPDQIVAELTIASIIELMCKARKSHLVRYLTHIALFEGSIAAAQNPDPDYHRTELYKHLRQRDMTPQTLVMFARHIGASYVLDHKRLWLFDESSFNSLDRRETKIRDGCHVVSNLLKNKSSVNIGIFMLLALSKQSLAISHSFMMWPTTMPRRKLLEYINDLYNEGRQGRFYINISQKDKDLASALNKDVRLSKNPRHRANIIELLHESHDNCCHIHFQLEMDIRTYLLYTLNYYTVNGMPPIITSSPPKKKKQPITQNETTISESDIEYFSGQSIAAIDSNNNHLTLSSLIFARNGPGLPSSGIISEVVKDTLIRFFVAIRKCVPLIKKFARHGFLVKVMEKLQIGLAVDDRKLIFDEDVTVWETSDHYWIFIRKYYAENLNVLKSFVQQVRLSLAIPQQQYIDDTFYVVGAKVPLPQCRKLLPYLNDKRHQSFIYRVVDSDYLKNCYEGCITVFQKCIRNMKSISSLLPNGIQTLASHTKKVNLAEQDQIDYTKGLFAAAPPAWITPLLGYPEARQLISDMAILPYINGDTIANSYECICTLNDILQLETSEKSRNYTSDEWRNITGMLENYIDGIQLRMLLKPVQRVPEERESSFMARRVTACYNIWNGSYVIVNSDNSVTKYSSRDNTALSQSSLANSENSENSENSPVIDQVVSYLLACVFNRPFRGNEVKWMCRLWSIKIDNDNQIESIRDIIEKEFVNVIGDMVDKCVLFTSLFRNILMYWICFSLKIPPFDMAFTLTDMNILDRWITIITDKIFPVIKIFELGFGFQIKDKYKKASNRIKAVHFLDQLCWCSSRTLINCDTSGYVYTKFDRKAGEIINKTASPINWRELLRWPSESDLSPAIINVKSRNRREYPRSPQWVAREPLEESEHEPPEEP